MGYGILNVSGNEKIDYYIIWIESVLLEELAWESESNNKDLPDRDGEIMGDMVPWELSRSSGVASESENKLSLW